MTRRQLRMPRQGTPIEDGAPRRHAMPRAASSPSTAVAPKPPATHGFSAHADGTHAHARRTASSSRKDTTCWRSRTENRPSRKRAMNGRQNSTITSPAALRCLTAQLGRQRRHSRPTLSPPAGHAEAPHFNKTRDTACALHHAYALSIYFYIDTISSYMPHIKATRHADSQQEEDARAVNT